MSAPVSAKALFRAKKPKRHVDANQLSASTNWPMSRTQVQDARDPLDFDPTPEDATASFLAAEASHIRALGNTVWENAVGAGHIATVLQSHAFEVIGSDVVNRGWPDTIVRSFYDFTSAPAPIIITNPPYAEINARDGHGRWLWHTMNLGGVQYVAMLLNAEWAFARINGMDELFAKHPPSIEYKCCWKIDFRGGGNPPQRNSWFVWDTRHRGETITRRLFRETDDRQLAMEV